MPVYVPSIALFVLAAVSLVLLVLFIRERQKARKFALSYYTVRADAFCREAKNITSFRTAMELQNRYKNAVSSKFFTEHPIEKELVKALVAIIVQTDDSLVLKGIIGDVSSFSESERALWRKVKLEVRSYLKPFEVRGKLPGWLADTES